ncbi:MAG: hypothetical protein NVSMB52_16190 [Chloroflexota bacterium]
MLNLRAVTKMNVWVENKISGGMPMVGDDFLVVRIGVAVCKK